MLQLRERIHFGWVGATAAAMTIAYIATAPGSAVLTPAAVDSAIVPPAPVVVIPPIPELSARPNVVRPTLTLPTVPDADDIIDDANDAVEDANEAAEEARDDAEEARDDAEDQADDQREDSEHDAAEARRDAERDAAKARRDAERERAKAERDAAASQR
jgi:type IV secretory pathway VirB10-like protein